MKNLIENIDQYISSFPTATQNHLKQMRKVISKAAPKAKESIKYAMPTFEYYGNLVHFAAFKNHIGFYPAPSGLKAFQKEIDAFAKALFKPVSPICLVVGGAKVSSKISLLNNIIPKVNKIIIGGAMSNTFLKALGNDMQSSLVEDEFLAEAKTILENAKKSGVKVYLPVDVVITNNIEQAIDIRIVPVQDLLPGFSAVDIGPATVKLFEEAIGLSNTIIWNGPMGIFEIDKFSKGTFSNDYELYR